MCCSPRGHKGSDMTKATQSSTTPVPSLCLNHRDVLANGHQGGVIKKMSITILFTKE